MTTNTAHIDSIYIGPNAIPQLLDYCDANRITSTFLVADVNTYRVLGERVDQALFEHGIDNEKIILSTEEVVADGRHIFHVLLEAGRRQHTYIAVGSGTITDITRFCSHRTGTTFISLPTAPSVDGFTSVGAPMIIDGVKRTVYCHPPVAIFGDIDTLTSAPRPMIAAGFGDVVGKYTCIADWRLGGLLWNEDFDAAIAQRSLDAAIACAARVDEIGAATPEGIRSLLDSLIETGFCMLEFGGSPPASGAEHYYSHFWEMKLLEEGRPAVLHGAKVGVAALMVSRIYEQIRGLSQEDVVELLAKSELPDRERETARIRAVYRDMADELIGIQEPFLRLTEGTYAQLKQRIADNWPQVLEIASHVPSPADFQAMLETVGGATDARDLGFHDAEIALGAEESHYLRNRFTIRKLIRVLGIQA